jgi:hypothetical protein
MKKIIFTVLVFSVFLAAGIAIAQGAAKNSQQDDLEYTIPEQDGTYDVPGRPELKVRVFVHNPKAKPEPIVSPALTCGLSDPNSDAIVDPGGWYLPKGTWVYRLNTNSVPFSVGSGNLSNIAQLGFSAWSDAISNKVTFTAGSPTSATRANLDGQNIIAWGRTSGSALAVTYTWYYTSGLLKGQVAEVDTIMNLKFNWSWTPFNLKNLCASTNSYDAQDILTHELGHWVGLNDEYTSAYTDNTMYGYGSKAEVKKDTLTTGDASGVSAIYR